MKPPNATKAPGEGKAPDEPVYTSQWDRDRKTWVDIPPTPLSQIWGRGAFRRPKERKT